MYVYITRKVFTNYLLQNIFLFTHSILLIFIFIRIFVFLCVLKIVGINSYLHLHSSGTDLNSNTFCKLFFICLLSSKQNPFVQLTSFD